MAFLKKNKNCHHLQNFTDLASTVVVPFSSPFPQVLCWQSEVEKYYHTFGGKSDNLLEEKGTWNSEQSEVSEQASLHSVQNNTTPPH
jgi:hypothetical protein